MVRGGVAGRKHVYKIELWIREYNKGRFGLHVICISGHRDWLWYVLKHPTDHRALHWRSAQPDPCPSGPFCLSSSYAQSMGVDLGVQISRA